MLYLQMSTFSSTKFGARSQLILNARVSSFDISLKKLYLGIITYCLKPKHSAVIAVTIHDQALNILSPLLQLLFQENG